MSEPLKDAVTALLDTHPVTDVLTTIAAICEEKITRTAPPQAPKPPIEVEGLEHLIDLTSIQEVMTALSDICRKKGEHEYDVLKNESRAIYWQKWALAIGRVHPYFTPGTRGKE